MSTTVFTNPDWDTRVYDSCESLNDGFPEPANIFGSIVVFLLGLYGMLFSQLNELPTFTLYALMYVWGTMSTAYHNTGKLQWRDASNIGAYNMIWYTLTLVGERTIDLATKEGKVQYFSKACLCTFAYGGLAYTLSQQGVSGDAWDMRLDFAEVLGIVQFIILIMSLVSAWMLRTKISSSTVRYMSVGAGLIFIANMMWMTTEPECRDSDGSLKKKFFGYTRMIWYMASSLGLHYIAQCTIKMELVALDEPCSFHDTEGTIGKWLLYVFPLVKAQRTKKPKKNGVEKEMEPPVVEEVKVDQA